MVGFFLLNWCHNLQIRERTLILLIALLDFSWSQWFPCCIKLKKSFKRWSFLELPLAHAFTSQLIILSSFVSCRKWKISCYLSNTFHLVHLILLSILQLKSSAITNLKNHQFLFRAVFIFENSQSILVKPGEYYSIVFCIDH